MGDIRVITIAAWICWLIVALWAFALLHPLGSVLVVALASGLLWWEWRDLTAADRAKGDE